jgi:hypothetical protein
MLSYGGRLVLINFVLSSLAMVMLSFLKYQKRYYISWTFIDPVSFGKEMIIKINTS